MADEATLGAINQLSEEEHELLGRESDGSATDADRARLKTIEIELDRCWDLLRQRRARREAGLPPDDAAMRPEGTVEGYQQ